jgi:hypothetical protein
VEKRNGWFGEPFKVKVKPLETDGGLQAAVGPELRELSHGSLLPSPVRGGKTLREGRSKLLAPHMRERKHSSM